MPKRNGWSPRAKVRFEAVRESEFTALLAELGELIYGELDSRQVRKAISSQPEPVAQKRKEVAK